MRDLSSENEFLLEAAQNFGIARQFRPDQLEGNGAIELYVAGLVHGAHSATAQEKENFVAASEDGPGFQIAGSEARRHGLVAARHGPVLGSAGFIECLLRQ